MVRKRKKIHTTESLQFHRACFLTDSLASLKLAQLQAMNLRPKTVCLSSGRVAANLDAFGLEPRNGTTANTRILFHCLNKKIKDQISHQLKRLVRDLRP